MGQGKLKIEDLIQCCFVPVKRRPTSACSDRLWGFCHHAKLPGVAKHPTGGLRAFNEESRRFFEGNQHLLKD